MAESRLPPYAATHEIAAVPEPPEAVLKVRPDGPNVITGEVVIAGAKTTTTGRTTVVLCRCGESRNKPYCDGTHTRIGFRDSGRVPIDADSGTRKAGKVTVTPTRNGPLECVGPLVIESADGRVVCREATSLCRCGQSQTKPFCDRSHEKIGFVG